MKRYLCRVMVALPLVYLLLHIGGEAGDKKESPWKPFLPFEVSGELRDRSFKVIRDSANTADAKSRTRVDVELAILEGYLLSEKNRDSEKQAALRVALIAARKQELKELAAFGATIPVVPKAKLREFNHMEVPLADLMEIFRGKAKGGEGIHVDLQYQPKLAKLNGIEALIGALAAKKISDDNLAKIAKELPNLAYRTAVVASITYEHAPKKDAEQWRDLSLKMRDASIELAESAKKKDAGGVFKAAQALESTCTQCHSAFKGK